MTTRNMIPARRRVRARRLLTAVVAVMACGAAVSSQFI